MKEIVDIAFANGYPSFLGTRLNAELLIDLDFWVAIGRGLGWKKYIWISYSDYCHLNNRRQTDEEDWSPDTMGLGKYATRDITPLYFQHLYIEHRAQGKSDDEFFTHLIKYENANA